MDKIRIDKEYVAAMLIELLFEKGLSQSNLVDKKNNAITSYH